MSRTGLFSHLSSVAFLATVGEVDGIEGNPTREREEPATMDVQAASPSDGIAVTTVDSDGHPQTLDAVAGSEFVDDRIRLQE